MSRKKTTDEFLRQFGLETLKELPSLDLYSDEEAKSSMDVLNKELEELESTYNFYMEEARAISNKIMFLKRIISEINA